MGVSWGSTYLVTKSTEVEKNFCMLVDNYPTPFAKSDADVEPVIPNFIENGNIEFQFISNKKKALLATKENILEATAREYRDAVFSASELEMDIDEIKLQIEKAKLLRDTDEMERLFKCLNNKKGALKECKRETALALKQRRKAVKEVLESDIKHLFQ